MVSRSQNDLQMAVSYGCSTGILGRSVDQYRVPI